MNLAYVFSNWKGKKMSDKCLYDKGNKCLILRKKICIKCKFYKENTEENKILYIDNVKEEIKKYAETHK